MRVSLIHDGEGKFRFGEEAPSSGSHLDVGKRLHIEIDETSIIRYENHEIYWATRCVDMLIRSPHVGVSSGMVVLNVFELNEKGEHVRRLGTMRLDFDDCNDLDPFLTNDARMRAIIRTDLCSPPGKVVEENKQ